MPQHVRRLLLVLAACALPAWGAGIAAGPDAGPHRRLAAAELRRYLYLRTGELLDLRPADAAARITLRVDPALAAEQYNLRASAGRLTISAGSELGVLYGAYAFAEKLGVRFTLAGDVLPDERMPFAIPDLDETAAPAFAIRGLLPFHDFPEGPDLWSADDYKAVLAQMVKLRMNFIGLHTYTESGWGSEPTSWLGRPEDVDEAGRPRFSYAAHYFSTARQASGHAPRKVDDMLFGGALLCESDPWGPPVMAGLMPHGRTLEEKNEVFARTGNLLRDAFTYARRFGVKTCVGTEIPLTHPTRLLPHELRAHLAEKGLAITNPAVHRQLYEGTFLRAMRAYPLDYYWLWTPEAWRGPQPDSVVEATRMDLLAAVDAAKAVNAPFTLATAGWTLGPSRDRTMFDRELPTNMPFSCINLELGTVPVDPGFARLTSRPGWAIPWLEDDLSMSSAQLWAGRILRDAHDAHRYGCDGLLGIHWRTAEIAPMVAALAEAQWRVPSADAARPQDGAIRVDGGETASFGAPVEATELDPVYQTVRYDVKGYDLAVPNGRYRVTLQFNEPAYDAPGKRVFGVVLQARKVIDRLDIFARVGRNKALDIVFEDVEVRDGWLRIGFLKDISSQLIGADKAEAAGKYIEFPCIAGIVAEAPGKTLKVNCGGPAWNDYVADPGPVSIPRYLPVGDFYRAWAGGQFGPDAAAAVGAIFARLDGHLPTPAPHCPGGIAVHDAPWASVRGAYAFADELAALRPRIRGAGNQARFDTWVGSFRYLRAIARVGCARGALNRAMGAQPLVNETALAARRELQGAWREMVTLALETADTWGSIGHIFTHEMFNRGTLGLLEGHDAALARALGGALPPDLAPDHAYHGQPRLLVPTCRSVAEAGEALALRVVVLDTAAPKSANLRWRPLGAGDWQAIPLQQAGRGVYAVTLPPLAADDAVEYYVEATTAAGATLRWPATAPALNHTVVAW